jgi:hypothetical protein
MDIRVFFLVVGLLLITGCVGLDGPSGPIIKEKQELIIKVNTLESLQQVQIVCGPDTAGCAKPYTNHCSIWYERNSWHTLVHEMKHCFYGTWHN